MTRTAKIDILKNGITIMRKAYDRNKDEISELYSQIHDLAEQNKSLIFSIDTAKDMITELEIKIGVSK